MRRKPHILLADDYEDFRVLAALELKSLGFEVTTAATVGQALAAILKRDVQAVVTALDMPDGGGRVIHWAAQAWHPGLPIVVLSDREPDPDDPLLERTSGLFQRPCNFTMLARHLRQLTA